MMVSFWVFVVAVILVAGAGYYLGNKAAKEEMQRAWQERVEEMVQVKLEQVGQLYNETYRNVLRDFVKIAKEEIEKNGQ